MNKENILALAKKYLSNSNVLFVEPGTFGRLDGYKQEVIFLNPDMLDPNVAVVIPEDIRVWVDTKTEEVTFIYQM